MKHSKMIAAKRIAVAVAAVCATMSAPAFAADAKSLLDLMLKKGVITQAEYDEYMKSDAYENQQFKDQRIDQDVSKSIKYIQKREKDGSVKEGGFGFKSADGNSEINLTGRVHFDARMIDNDLAQTSDRDSGSMSDRLQARRVRLGVTGILNKDINYEVVTNLVGSNANLIDTAWMNYNIKPEFQMRFGRFKQPFGLETLQSSNNISFMERSYQDQIVPGKQLGLMAHGEQGAFTYAGSLFQQGFDRSSTQGGIAPEAVARVTSDLAKVFSAPTDTMLHVGLAASAGQYDIVPTTSSQDGSTIETKGAFLSFNDENGGLRNVYRNRIYGARPCTKTVANCVGGYSLNAADAAQIDRKLLGFELAAAYGPTKLQYERTEGDYTASSYKSTANSNTQTPTSSKGKVKVEYLELMHNITGESWAGTYKSGVVGGIRPNSPFKFSDMSGTGAWQIGLRFSRYDASDFGANASGGGTKYGTGDQYEVEGSPKGNTTTIGLNWVLNANARIMLNYSMTRFDTALVPVDVRTPTGTTQSTNKIDSEKIISLRTQINF